MRMGFHNSVFILLAVLLTKLTWGLALSWELSPVKDQIRSVMTGNDRTRPEMIGNDRK